MIHVCIKCTDRAKGCTLISEDGKRLPLVCVDEITRKAITCEWMEVPKKEESTEIIIGP
jgi:hypothetical protein